jgi:nitrate/nitrite transporter NarK
MSTSASPTVWRTTIVGAAVAASMGLIVVVALGGLPGWAGLALLVLVCVVSAAVAARVLLNDLPRGARDDATRAHVEGQTP